MVVVQDVAALGAVILTDIALAGDNALVIGLAVARLPARQRRFAITVGIAIATALRIILAFGVLEILQVVGLRLAGGLLLIWVAWKLWREFETARRDPDIASNVEYSGSREASPGRSLRGAAIRIVVADLSMSLDNVLAVAGVARNHPWILATGLVLSVALVGVASAWVARLLDRFPWIGYLGLLIILFVALRMIWNGSERVLTLMPATFS